MNDKRHTDSDQDFREQVSRDRTLYFRCTRCAWLAYDFEVSIGPDAKQIICNRCAGYLPMSMEDRYYGRGGEFRALNDDID